MAQTYSEPCLVQVLKWLKSEENAAHSESFRWTHFLKHLHYAMFLMLLVQVLNLSIYWKLKALISLFALKLLHLLCILEIPILLDIRIKINIQHNSFQRNILVNQIRNLLNIVHYCFSSFTLQLYYCVQWTGTKTNLINKQFLHFLSTIQLRVCNILVCDWRLDLRPHQ
jgi:hypothetical protein